MSKYALGLDYGTNSCRSLLVDLDTGVEAAGAVYPYPTGQHGVLTDPRDPNVARQHPGDYLSGLEAIVKGALRKAADSIDGFDPAQVIGIGIDTTGSTPMPVDRTGAPLALLPGFKDRLDAMAWLWKDHTSHAEAARITSRAAELRPDYLAKCGGTYSSEWFWSKALHCKQVAPDVFKAAFSFVECCDYLPAVLAGDTNPLRLKRSVCAAGHKAMYCAEWGGLPDAEFLAGLAPELAALRERLYSRAYTADTPVGGLCEEWARKLGLRRGIAIATGAFDAHMGAVGSGIREGVLSKILGTSTCDLIVAPSSAPVADIPGVCGIVDGSVLPGYYGIEAGQSAVGDIFLWFVNQLVPDRFGADAPAKFAEMERIEGTRKPGAHGLLALDWNNGNRTVLVDARLTGLLVGQTLHTEANEIYRALVEATAFGALKIVDRIESCGIPVKEVINCGGLAAKSPFLMQIYADVLNRPMKVARSDQTCALGAALFGAVAAGAKNGGFNSVEEAQRKLCGVRDTVFSPIPERVAVYKRLFVLYSELHDAFGTSGWHGRLAGVMKELIAVREAQRA